MYSNYIKQMAFGYRRSRTRTTNRFRRRPNGYPKKNGFNKRPSYKPLTYTFKRWGLQLNTILENNPQNPWPNSTIDIPGGPNQQVYDVRWNKAIFRLDYLPEYEEFTKLFKWYRILGIKIRISTDWQGADGTGLQMTNLPQGPNQSPWKMIPDWYLCSLIDKSNNFSPANTGAGGLEKAKTYSSFRMHTSDKAIYRSVHPRPLVNVGQGGSVYQVEGQRGWISTRNPSVDHFSFCFGVGPAAGFAPSTMPEYWKLIWRYDVKYVVQMKGVGV